MGRPLETPERRVPTEVELQHAANVAQALADKTRLGILSLLLSDTELSVGEIATKLGRAVPSTSQHLAKLKTGRLVVVRRQGTAMIYSLAGEHVSLLVENLLQHTEHELFPEPPHHSGRESLSHVPSAAVSTA